MEQKKVLIIEDEASIADMLTYAIKKEGLAVKAAANGEEGLSEVKAYKPDLILLDLMLPDMSGFDICKKITKDYSIPIIMLTARSDTFDKILGMELGADDYITKPFDIREVIVRMKAIFRRIERSHEAEETSDASTITIGRDIRLLKDQREVYSGTVRVELTNKEYELLVFLAENRGRVFSRSELLDKVWGFEFFGDTRTVDIHIQRLRKKLDDGNGNGISLIETVYGVGYKLI